MPVRTHSLQTALAPAPIRQDAALFAGYALFFLMVFGPYMTLKTLPYTGEGSVIRQIGFTGLYILVIVAARAGAHPTRLFPIPTSISLALGWYWLSLFWAIDPDIALRRLLLTTILMATIFMIVEMLKYEKTILVIRESMILILVLNFLAVVAVPHIGVHEQLDVEGFGLDPDLVGNWKGLLVQKNFAGAVCVLTILAFVFDARAIKTWIRWAVILASAVFLFKTHAKTSLALLPVVVLVGWLFQNYNPRFRAFLGPSLILIALAAIAMSLVYWADIEGIFRRGDAFTGRVAIWKVLIAYWQDNWLLGSGYGSFWNIGGNKMPLFHYVKETDWVALVSIGHNGYIDLLAQTGLPGLVLAVVAIVIIPVKKLLTSVTVPRGQGALLMSILVFCILHNFLESSFFDRDAIIQIYVMLTIAMIEIVTARKTNAAQASHVPT